jgi:hypothetical protein
MRRLEPTQGLFDYLIIGLCSLADQCLDLSQILAARDQDAAAAALAADADIGSQPDNLPLEAATGVGLAHANDITHTDVGVNGCHLAVTRLS